MTDTPPSPRPWYLSLTLVWEDDSDAFQQLNKALRELLVLQQLVYPAHHRLIHRRSRHSTAFAILRINRAPCSNTSLRQFAQELFEQLATEPIRNALATAWGPGLSLTAASVKAFDDSTTIQFCPNDALASFRNRARSVLVEPVQKLITVYPNDAVESLLGDCTKSSGANAFGSIARSPCRSDKSHLRWIEPLPFQVTLTFKQVRLLVSDDALTNPRIRDKEEHLITQHASENAH